MGMILTTIAAVVVVLVLCLMGSFLWAEFDLWLTRRKMKKLVALHNDLMKSVRKGEL